VVQAKEDIAARIDALGRRLAAGFDLRLARVRARVAGLTSHRVFEAERGRLRSHAQRVDELGNRAESALRRRLEQARERARRAHERVEAFRWDRQIQERRETVGRHERRVADLLRARVGERRAALGRLAGKLDSLSPLAVLSRGYALVWDARGRLLREPEEVSSGDPLRIRVAGGEIAAVVAPGKEPA
jgi:exodeoxyribonuclease VII large subunit